MTESVSKYQKKKGKLKNLLARVGGEGENKSKAVKQKQKFKTPNFFFFNLHNTKFVYYED